MICAWDRGSIEEERENWKDDVMMDIVWGASGCLVRCIGRGFKVL
jgi:hypothetical protein